MIKRTSKGPHHTNEKIKWALVAALSVVLLLVLYFNLRPSGGGEQVLGLQGNKADAVDLSIPLTPEKDLMPPLEELTDTPERTNSMAPPPIQDIFSFASREDNAPAIQAMSPSGEEKLVLKGTIIDGDNSVAFINDEVLGLGDIINGFTVVEITADSTTIKNGEDVITVRAEEDEIDE